MSVHTAMLRQPFVGPCEAEAMRLRSHLSHLSSARISVVEPLSGFEARARRCRRAGHRYYTTAEVDEGYPLSGSCLPASCSDASSKDLHAAAEHVLGIGLQKIVAYTTFTASGSARASASSRRKDDTSGKNLRDLPTENEKQLHQTEWLELEYMNLAAGQNVLPRKYATATTLALTLLEFRGAVQDYIRAVWAVIAQLGTQMFGTALFLIAGTLDATIALSEFISIRMVSEMPFCGRGNFMDRFPEATLGIEVVLPPMWRLFVPRNFLDMPVRIDWGHPSFLACDMDMPALLHWTVPYDAMPAALELAQRGSCVTAVAKMLPELAAVFTVASSNSSIDWPMVEQRTVHCIQQLESAMWQIRVDESTWPSLLSRGKPFRSRFGGPAGSFTAFLCAPSRFIIELEAHAGIPPEPGCSARHVGIEVLPLMLAVQSGLYEALSDLAPPNVTKAMHGGRAPSAINPQFIEYHSAAVRHRAARRGGGPNPSAGDKSSAMSAAICVVGRARTFSDPEVYSSIAENVTGHGLGAEASLFYVLDIGDRTLNEYGEAFHTLPPAAFALVRDDNWGDPLQCKAFQLCGPACLYQFQKLRNCWHLVQAAEQSRGRRFDWIVRIRPDTVWRAPIGDLSDFDSSAIHLVMSVNNGDPEDNFALVPRRHAEAYFGIGEGCPTARDTQNGVCAIPWYEGAHITPECALRTRLAKYGVPVISFPKVYQIKREEVCREDDPRGCGKCSRGVCRYDYTQ